MKKIIVLLVLATLYSCTNNSKQTLSKEVPYDNGIVNGIVIKTDYK